MNHGSLVPAVPPLDRRSNIWETTPLGDFDPDIFQSGTAAAGAANAIATRRSGTKSSFRSLLTYLRHSCRKVDRSIQGITF